MSENNQFLTLILTLIFVIILVINQYRIHFSNIRNYNADNPLYPLYHLYPVPIHPKPPIPSYTFSRQLYRTLPGISICLLSRRDLYTLYSPIPSYTHLYPPIPSYTLLYPLLYSPLPPLSLSTSPQGSFFLRPVDAATLLTTARHLISAFCGCVV